MLKLHWYNRVLSRILPQSLLGRLSVVMVAGVMLTQLLGNFFWATQLRAESEAAIKTASQHVAHSASGAVRFIMSLPQNYRPLIIQQFREMGGTRFFININTAPITINQIANQVWLIWRAPYQHHDQRGFASGQQFSYRLCLAGRSGRHRRRHPHYGTARQLGTPHTAQKA